MPEWWVDELVPEGELEPDFERELRAMLDEAWPSRGGTQRHASRRVVVTVLGVAAAIALFIVAVGWLGGDTRPRITPSTEPGPTTTEPPAPSTSVVLDVTSMRETLKNTEWVSGPVATEAAGGQPGWLRFNGDLTRIDGFTGCQPFTVNTPLAGDRVVLEKPVLGGGSCGPTLAYLQNADRFRVVVGPDHAELEVYHDDRVTYRLVRASDFVPVGQADLVGAWKLWPDAVLTLRVDATVDIGGCVDVGRWSFTAPSSLRFATTLTVDELGACAGQLRGADQPLVQLLSGGDVQVAGMGASVLMSGATAKLWMNRADEPPVANLGLDVPARTIWGLRLGVAVSQSLVESTVQHALAQVTSTGVAPTEQATEETLLTPLVSCSGSKGTVLGYNGFWVILSVKPTDVTVVGWMLGRNGAQQATHFAPRLESVDNSMASLLGTADEPSLRLGLTPDQLVAWWLSVAARLPNSHLTFFDANGAEVIPTAATSATITSDSVDGTSMSMAFTFTDGGLSWMMQTVC